jgi:hypothetical protein
MLIVVHPEVSMHHILCKRTWILLIPVLAFVLVGCVDTLAMVQSQATAEAGANQAQLDANPNSEYWILISTQSAQQLSAEITKAVEYQQSLYTATPSLTPTPTLTPTPSPTPTVTPLGGGGVLFCVNYKPGSDVVVSNYPPGVQPAQNCEDTLECAGVSGACYLNGAVVRQYGESIPVRIYAELKPHINWDLIIFAIVATLVVTAFISAISDVRIKEKVLAMMMGSDKPERVKTLPTESGSTALAHVAPQQWTIGALTEHLDKYPNREYYALVMKAVMGKSDLRHAYQDAMLLTIPQLYRILESVDQQEAKKFSQWLSQRLSPNPRIRRH